MESRGRTPPVTAPSSSAFWQRVVQRKQLHELVSSAASLSLLLLLTTIVTSTSSFTISGMRQGSAAVTRQWKRNAYTHLGTLHTNSIALGASTVSRRRSLCRSSVFGSPFYLRTHHYIDTTRLFSVAPQVAYGNLNPAIEETNGKQLEDVLFQEMRPTKQSAQHETVSVQPSCQNIEDEDLFHGLKSRPVPGGNWDPKNSLKWAESFGTRSKAKQERYNQIAHLKPGDEGYFDVPDMKVKGVTIVRTKEEAEKALHALMNAPLDTFHACDTEVMDINLNNEGPVGNGYVTCLSVYSGPDFDYGLGEKPGRALWIDNLDDSFGILSILKPFLESEKHLKVWHNYGFDRHVLFNEGIDVKGLGGDTMHMARLWDTSRARRVGSSGSPYSLESLTFDLLNRRKVPMKEIFGLHRIRKDGTEGSLVDVPPVELLQRDPRFRTNWILYSAYDAQGTWLIRNKLQQRLEKMDWYDGCNLYNYYQMYLREFADVLTDMERRGMLVNAKDYLAKVEIQAREERDHHEATFRNWAASIMGADGLAMNPASAAQLSTFLFGGAFNSKTHEQTETRRVFKTPKEEIPEEALLAYEEREKRLTGMVGPATTDDKDDLDRMSAAQLKELCKARGLKVTGKKAELQERLRGYFLSTGGKVKAGNLPQDDFESMSDDDLRHACITRNIRATGTRAALLKRLRGDTEYLMQLWAQVDPPQSPEGYRAISEVLAKAAGSDENIAAVLKDVQQKKNAPSKYVDVTITSIGMIPEKYTSGGAPSVTADVLRSLAGDPFSDPPKYGKAHAFLKDHKAGHDACVALYSLTAIGSIDTMIATFLSSLQSRVDEQSRVHCSLNFNTETGRLSSRGPNLQNQPALEKDKYKIRKAFQSSPKNNLIVADYGQLELRLLASMTRCQSMIDAFKQGGDFHSRTAMNMFDYIQKKVDEGEILFEWDYSKGDPPKPLLKDEYASERRKAKTLNFSIAYGKTAHGLSQDWGVTIEEANETLQAWYNARPEVLNWQKKTKKTARQKGVTRTLMGRYRQLPGAKSNERKLIGQAERASINTPIQGGAADVAMMAMIKINKNEKLRRLGWILLMQIHDEMILEGPEETAEEAFEEVVKCMEAPWCFGLEETAVPLLVDGSCAHKDWYDAK